MQDAASLRTQAEAQAARFPSLLAEAQRLAATILLGEHGRRRAGMGDDFWQYRPMQPGDSYRMIDWRQSARSEMQFVREREWQTAQSIMLWVDGAASLRFRSHSDLPQKIERARVLALSLSIALLRGGERVGLTGAALPPQRGEGQIARLAYALLDEDSEDYAPPNTQAMLSNARALFVSDFLGNPETIETAIARAADRGTTGILLQVLDPVEENFPFKGRSVFQSISGQIQHETHRADDLRQEYIARLAERRALLIELCRAAGWQFHSHTTDQPAQQVLLWLYQAMEGARR